MALYEHIFLCRQDVTQQQVDDLAKQFSTVIADNGGSIKKNEYWGLKSLTFRIRKNRKAHFTMLNIDAPPAALFEMERQMSINEDIIRFMTVRVEEHEEGPSAMLQKRERDEKLERSFEPADSFDMSMGGKPARKGGGRFRDNDNSDIDEMEG